MSAQLYKSQLSKEKDIFIKLGTMLEQVDDNKLKKLEPKIKSMDLRRRKLIGAEEHYSI